MWNAISYYDKYRLFNYPLDIDKARNLPNPESFMAPSKRSLHHQWTIGYIVLSDIRAGYGYDMKSPKHLSDRIVFEFRSYFILM